MSEEFTLIYGFRLNVSGVDGKPTVFIVSVFPEQVLGMEATKPSGAKITLKLADGRTTTLQVTQSIQEIKTMMEQCKELDK